MADTIRYFVENMRVTFPTNKAQEKNPDRFMTVHGSAFYLVDGKGNRSKDALSITSKYIDKDQAKNPLFEIDPQKGTLTLAEGRRGRTASIGASIDELNAQLKALREA